MKAAPFDYLRASSTAEVVKTLAESGGGGKILAGGQSLVPVLAMRLGRPQLLIDVNRIPGLSDIDDRGDTVRVGALVRHSELAEQRVSPMLAEAASWIGHGAIRSRGTCGGSIAHADPSAELPVVASALDAKVHVVGANGNRTVSVDDLFIGPLETSLAEDEMIIATDFVKPTRWGFAEWARRHGDFGLVTVAVAEIAGLIRIAVGGVCATTIRAEEAEHILSDGRLDPGRIAEAARAAAGVVTAGDDVHATVRYRLAMTEAITCRALEQAAAGGLRGAS